jgi:hypothetical protein
MKPMNLAPQGPSDGFKGLLGSSGIVCVMSRTMAGLLRHGASKHTPYFLSASDDLSVISGKNVNAIADFCESDADRPIANFKQIDGSWARFWRNQHIACPA